MQTKIKTCEFQISASGYQVGGSIHLKCANRIANKLMLDDNIRNKVVLDLI